MSVLLGTRGCLPSSMKFRGSLHQIPGIELHMSPPVLSLLSTSVRSLGLGLLCRDEVSATRFLKAVSWHCLVQVRAQGGR